MGFSLAVAGLLLFFCISPGMRAASVSKIPGPVSDAEPGIPVEEFKLRVSENGTRFHEKISIDQKKDIEYFKVPAHNGLSETDNLYDFKMNITVSRVKKDRVCHIKPLPSDLPRPNVLSKGLKALSRLPPSHMIEKIVHQWRVGDKVDKSTLRQEVRDFCGQFPVYRLVPFTRDSVSVASGDEPDTRADRARRDMEFTTCENRPPPTLCRPDQYEYKCKIRDQTCVYFHSCTLNTQKKTICEDAVHEYNSLICCQISCPISDFPHFGPWHPGFPG